MSIQRTVLLLNASNLRNYLVYPYAFVQVSEIADRFNIRTVRRDMIEIPEAQWGIYLQNLFNKNHFDMVLITLRNSDTCSSEDYQTRNENRNYHQINYISQYKPPHYFPIEVTRNLINYLRKITNIPVVIGGYAFSMMPERLMDYLKPDYGIIGGPDSFFERFESILNCQELDQIANLIYSKHEKLHKGPIHFFPPAPRREYTNEIIADRQAFNSHFISEPNVEIVTSVPIEVVRGCLMKCTYCSEPLIKGTELQYRDLDVIEDEINFLGKYGLNKLYMITSEVNTGGNDFVLELADRIIRINEKRRSYEKVSWFIFYLMTLSQNELRHLRKAGFLGGANDIVTFDDNNLTKIKAPCKSNEVIKHLIGAKEVIKEEYHQNGETYPSLTERLFKKQKSKSFKPSDNFMRSWNFFLGNTAATPETIRITLKAVDDADLSQFFDSCYVNRATRIYDYIKPSDELLKNIWSKTDKGLTESYNELYPSFTYPPALIHHFGSIETVEEFFIHLGDTYLSCNYISKQDWNWFLANHIDVEFFSILWRKGVKSRFQLNSIKTTPEVQEFLLFLNKNPTTKNIKLLFTPTPSRKSLMNITAHIAIRLVFYHQEKELIQ
ncbi:MAG: hypothetical protein ACXAC7_12960, partial [Candidatus Hodarchaeales archaeon]